MPRSAARSESTSGSPGRVAAPAIELHTACMHWRESDLADTAHAAAAATLGDNRWTAAGADFAAAELSIELADDLRIAELNRTYRGKDGPTNVLAFPAFDRAEMAQAFLGPRPPALPLLLGDVVLAFETVTREAREQNKPPAHHLAHLVVHGTLHCLGYDHAANAEAAEMEAVERRILSGLGIADPYAAYEIPDGGGR